MSESAPPPASPSSADPPDHARTIAQLVDELQAHQKATRVVLLVGSLVMVLIMVLFGVGLYAATRSNLSGEKMQPALMKRVEARTPELQRKAAEALSLAMPTYRDLARQKMSEIAPQLQDRAVEQFEQLPQMLRDQLSHHIEAVQQRVEANMQKQIEQRFDQLPPERIASLTEHFVEEFERVGGSVQDQLLEKYGQQLTRLETVLDGFDVDVPAGMSNEDLQMKLVEDAALLVVHLARNPDELPTPPTTLGDTGLQSVTSTSEVQP